MTLYGGTGRPPKDGEEVQAACWCDRSIVWVRIEEIRAGRTAACYRMACKPPEDNE
jgi:hypothetical protein